MSAGHRRTMYRYCPPRRTNEPRIAQGRTLTNPWTSLNHPYYCQRWNELASLVYTNGTTHSNYPLSPPEMGFSEPREHSPERNHEQKEAKRFSSAPKHSQFFYLINLTSIPSTFLPPLSFFPLLATSTPFCFLSLFVFPPLGGIFEHLSPHPIPLVFSTP
jgi:hypothetical protein